MLRRLATATTLLCVAPPWGQRHGQPLTPAELPRDQILMPFTADIQRDFRLQPRSPSAGDAAFACRVLPGAVLSDAAAEPSRRSDLVQLPPDWQIGAWQVVAVLPGQKYLPPRTRAFLDLLAEQWLSLLADTWAAQAAAGCKPCLARDGSVSRNPDGPILGPAGAALAA